VALSAQPNEMTPFRYERPVAGAETVAGSPSKAAGFISPRMFWSLLGITVFVLVGLVVRLVKQTG
jgi:hypothetical protein